MSGSTIILKEGSEVTLRRAVPEDLENVWEMLSTLSDESLRWLPHPIIREEIEAMMAEIDYDTLLPVVAVSESPDDRERIAALATLGFQRGVARRHRAELDIVVHDDFQGLGLGTALTQHMIDVAGERGLKKVYLKTAMGNLRAIRLYEKLGFTIEGRLVMEHFHHRRREYGDDYRMAILL